MYGGEVFLEGVVEPVRGDGLEVVRVHHGASPRTPAAAAHARVVAQPTLV